MGVGSWLPLLAAHQTAVAVVAATAFVAASPELAAAAAAAAWVPSAAAAVAAAAAVPAAVELAAGGAPAAPAAAAAAPQAQDPGRLNIKSSNWCLSRSSLGCILLGNTPARLRDMYTSAGKVPVFKL